MKFEFVVKCTAIIAMMAIMFVGMTSCDNNEEAVESSDGTTSIITEVVPETTEVVAETTESEVPSVNLDDLSMFYLALEGYTDVIQGDYRYYIEFESEGFVPESNFCKENLATGEKTVIKEDVNPLFVNVVGDSIFYAKAGGGYYEGVNMVSVDGSKYTEISDKMVAVIAANDKYVYYVDDSMLYGATTFYRVDYTAEELSEEVLFVLSDRTRVTDMSLLGDSIIYSVSEYDSQNNESMGIFIYDTVAKETEKIGIEHSSLKKFDRMWAHGDYIYVLRWHNGGDGYCDESEVAEAMKRDLYRYSISTDTYEFCELPLAEYESGAFGGCYGELISDIIDSLESELPNDFNGSSTYKFVTVE